MPLYEYVCADCHHKSTFLVRHRDAEHDLKCNFCSSGNLTRIMSRFASLKSDEDRLESLADPDKWSGLDENDPKSVARFINKMGREMGEDVSRDEIEQMADEAAHEAETGFHSSNESENDSDTTGLD